MYCCSLLLPLKAKIHLHHIIYKYSIRTPQKTQFLLLERAIIEFCLRSKWVCCRTRKEHTSTQSVENAGLLVLDLAVYIVTTRLDRFNSRQ